MKKLVIFSLFVASMFTFASCGGPSEDQLKSLDSLNSQLDQALNELNSSLDSIPMVDTTITE